MSTDIVISLDVTGSMSPVLNECRRKVKQTIDTLFDSIDDLRIGLIVHGDYCDGVLAIQRKDLTTDRKSLIDFINKAQNTNGGDSDECYEAVLAEVNGFSWQANNRALVLIADAMPHEIGYRYNSIVVRNDWRDEAKKLAEESFYLCC